METPDRLASLVLRGNERKYRRFRGARFYGGIATADCIGCNLRCVFCWSWNETTRPEASGYFVSPEEVARRLTDIARKGGYRKVRISGNEPTIGKAHLVSVLEHLPADLLFILETNGLLIGEDPTYANDLARFRNLYVRVSLKGTTEEEFGRLTGANPDRFRLQLQAVENLFRAGVRVQPAVMASFSTPEGIAGLERRFQQVAPGLEEIEVEELVLYGNVQQRLRKAGISCGSAHTPNRVPPEQV